MRSQLGVEKGQQLELEDQHGPLPVYVPIDIKVPQRGDPFLRGPASAHDRSHLAEAPLSLLFEQHEKQILFCFEVSVESAACMAYGRCDVLDTGGLESVARENSPRRSEQRPTSRLG